MFPLCALRLRIHDLRDGNLDQHDCAARIASSEGPETAPPLRLSSSRGKSGCTPIICTSVRAKKKSAQLHVSNVTPGERLVSSKTALRTERISRTRPMLLVASVIRSTHRANSGATIDSVMPLATMMKYSAEPCEDVEDAAGAEKPRRVAVLPAHPDGEEDEV